MNRFQSFFAPDDRSSEPSPAFVENQRPRLWSELCNDNELQGRWVALDACRYDASSGQVLEGVVVDVDDDLGALCSRVKSARCKHCAIVLVSSEIH